MGYNDGPYFYTIGPLELSIWPLGFFHIYIYFFFWGGGGGRDNFIKHLSVKNIATDMFNIDMYLLYILCELHFVLNILESIYIVVNNT